MTESLVGGERRTRAERMYDEHRVSGSAFWRELAPQERAVWIICASQQARAEAAEARVAEVETVLRDATKFIEYPGRFDGVERLALACRCRLALMGEGA